MLYYVNDGRRLVRTEDAPISLPGWREVSFEQWQDFRAETNQRFNTPAKRKELAALRGTTAGTLVFPASKPPASLSCVTSSRGAPMGRRDMVDTSADEFDGTMYLSLLPMVDGDYDKGGAYWGSGNSSIGWMHRAWYYGEDNEGNIHHIDMFVRAANRSLAKDMIRETLPLAKFH